MVREYAICEIHDDYIKSIKQAFRHENNNSVILHGIVMKLSSHIVHTMNIIKISHHLNIETISIN